MSYSIDEGIDDQKRRLKAMAAIREKFPEATLSQGEWYASSVGEEATDVTYDKDRQTVRAVDASCGMHVYDHWASMDVATLLYVLKDKHPETYRVVVDVVARRKEQV